MTDDMMNLRMLVEKTPEPHYLSPRKPAWSSRQISEWLRGKLGHSRPPANENLDGGLDT